MPSIQRPRGTRDFGPEEMGKRRYIEAILRKTAETFGYQEIATPTFEHTELYTERSGEAIKNEMYNFEDKGKRKLSLRPELTLPTMRFFANDMRNVPKPIKVYYFGNCFRYERPQSGRFREFWQFGAEVIGGGIAGADADIIALAVHSLQNSGLEDFTTRIGHLGMLRALLSEMGIEGANQSKCMQQIDKGELKGLYDLLQTHGASGETIQRIKALLNLEKSHEIPGKARDILGQNLDAKEAMENLEEILDILRGLGVEDYTIDLGIARGLDYYTGMVFEIDVPSLGAEKQVCGGGAYALAELFDVEKTNSTGFAIGFDRVMMALERKNVKIPVPTLVVYVIPLGSNAKDEALKVVTTLRRSDIPCDMALTDRSISKHMKHANLKRTRFTIIIGDEEIGSKQATVKDMDSGEQKKVGFEEIVDFIETSLEN